jgi:long-chain acyl-CoA synthetase
MQVEDSDDTAYMGRPIRGAEIQILSGDVPQPCGSPGEVALRGSCMMAAYVGEEQQSCSRFWKGYFRTGDLGWRDESGNLYVAGRLRPWINTGGVKVDPLEVQQVLRQIPGVRNCKVGPEPGPRGMDIVAVEIELEPDASMTRADVVQHCRRYMAEFKIPRVVRFTSALAADLTGKTPERWS